MLGDFEWLMQRAVLNYQRSQLISISDSIAMLIEQSNIHGGYCIGIYCEYPVYINCIGIAILNVAG